MKSHYRHELSRTLAACVDAAGSAPPSEQVDQAQNRLMAQLRQAPAPARPDRHSGAATASGAESSPPLRARWLAAASMAALAIIVIAIPLLTQQGDAFAAVQAHFRNFQTLSMRVEQRWDGQMLQTSNMVVDANGVLRTDIGDDLSVIVDPVRGRILTLLHGPKRAMLAPLTQAETNPEPALDLLAEIREFKGEAKPLAATRTIDGRVAHGWALEINGGQLVLWADKTGLPLAMEMETGGSGRLDIQYRFRFDAPVSPGYLSSDVPPGYRIVEPDSD